MNRALADSIAAIERLVEAACQWDLADLAAAVEGLPTDVLQQLRRLALRTPAELDRAGSDSEACDALLSELLALRRDHEPYVVEVTGPRYVRGSRAYLVTLRIDDCIGHLVVSEDPHGVFGATIAPGLVSDELHFYLSAEDAPDERRQIADRVLSAALRAAKRKAEESHAQKPKSH